MKKLFLALCGIFLFGNCTSHKKEDHQIIEVGKTAKGPRVDGKATDDCWNRTPWRKLDQIWSGNAYSHKDFSGRYKLSWDENHLYILVEIVDDVLYHPYEDLLEHWWDNDALIVFLDPDNSGGKYGQGTNALAYHIGLDGNVTGLGADGKPALYNDHISVAKTTNATTGTWEIAVRSYQAPSRDGTQPKVDKLTAGKKLGFALAYSDNDKSDEQENFIGSVYVHGEDKDEVNRNADAFGTILLLDRSF